MEFEMQLLCYFLVWIKFPMMKWPNVRQECKMASNYVEIHVFNCMSTELMYGM